VGDVNDQDALVPPDDLDDFGQVGAVGLHRVEALHDHEEAIAPVTHSLGLELGVEVVQVVVGELRDPPRRMPRTLLKAVACEGVHDDGVVFPDESGDDPEPGGPARREDRASLVAQVLLVHDLAVVERGAVVTLDDGTLPTMPPAG
jgi:hypothetical protein